MLARVLLTFLIISMLGYFYIVYSMLPLGISYTIFVNLYIIIKQTGNQLVAQLQLPPTSMRTIRCDLICFALRRLKWTIPKNIIFVERATRAKCQQKDKQQQKLECKAAATTTTAVIAISNNNYNAPSADHKQIDNDSAWMTLGYSSSSKECRHSNNNNNNMCVCVCAKSK